MFNFINLQKENKVSKNEKQLDKKELNNEKLIVDSKDYYFSNVIARASKTMFDCYNSKIKIKKTGTDG